MYKEEKFTLRPTKRSGDDLYIEGYGKRWGEKLTFTVGVSYLVAATFGLGVGGYRAWAAAGKYRQQRSYHSINTVGITASRFGNASAAASLMYCINGKIIDLVFEEEIQDFGRQARNTMVGAITGTMYKCTLGVRPMAVGCITGAALINIVSYTIAAMNQAGLIKFNIDL